LKRHSAAALDALQSETRQRNWFREYVTEMTTVREVTIAGHPFVLRTGDVVRAMRGVDPEPIASHYVVVGTRRFPPKQIISQLTGLDRADFTTHQARRTLIRLGFSAGRRPPRMTGIRGEPARLASTSAAEPLADRLRSFAGTWVAIRDDEILHSSESPRELVAWLSRHAQQADSMFRVPEDERAATGLAPL
jgi:hypothetical protein